MSSLVRIPKDCKHTRLHSKNDAEIVEKGVYLIEMYCRDCGFLVGLAKYDKSKGKENKMYVTFTGHDPEEYGVLKHD
jgi:hypothetical protein